MDKYEFNVNQIYEHLKKKDFFWTLEFVPSADKILKKELDDLDHLFINLQNFPYIAGFAITDRVHSDRDPDPITAASQILLRTGRQPLIHLAGKGRDVSDFSKSIIRLSSLDLKNILILTGDKLKEVNRFGKDRYFESVPAIQLVKKINPALNIAVAFNPFKYREEDCMAQYLKLEKKISAGADYFITQIGFDHKKFEELSKWKKVNNIKSPTVANLMMLYARNARYMRKHQLAGVTISNSFLKLLEFEEGLPDKGVDRALRRLALQIIHIKKLDYAGIQLTGMHTSEMLIKLDKKICELSDLCTNKQIWLNAWNECMRFPNGEVIEIVPTSAWYMTDSFTARSSIFEQYKFSTMKVLHHIFFSKNFLYSLFSLLLSPINNRHGKVALALEKFEKIIKKPLVGCDTCGNCRLEFTQYICPEACPKGLANGPCGGTIENLCEFRDRECIHSVKYRLAKGDSTLDSLRLNLIPSIPKEIRNTSSYPSYFSGLGIKITVIEPTK